MNNNLIIIKTVSFFLFTLGLLFFESTTVYAQNISDGIFIPRNGNYEGKIGLSHILINRTKGGTMEIIKGNWPSYQPVAQMETEFEVVDNDSGKSKRIKQSFDQDPNILFLEEGAERIGIRILFKLYDSLSTYYGHAMTELWCYPDGQIFITQGAMFENETAYKFVKSASIDIKVSKELLGTDYKNTEIKMNDENTPERFLFLTSTARIKKDNPGLALYWRTGKMEHDTYIYRSNFGETGAPSYFRWPDYFRQAYTQLTTPHYAKKVDKTKWPPGIGSQISKIVSHKQGVRLIWPIDKKVSAQPISFNAVFRLAMVQYPGLVKSYVNAERLPLTFQVTGGIMHGNNQSALDKGYNDQEGCYEIRKYDTNPLKVIIPKGSSKETVRIKIIGLSKHGGIRTTLDGKSLIPQLVSDGGIADDPLAPIHEQPEAPANAAIITVNIKNTPQTLTVSEEDGIQLVYQSRDVRRNFAIYSDKSGPRWSSMKFSLIDGHATNIRDYNKQEWAFTENLFHWFAWMGYTPEQMLDQLREFVIVKNGPDEIIFKYVSNNLNDGAQSESVLSISAKSPMLKINVVTTFKILSHWPYTSVQFFDGFPFRGVDPKEWWYKNVLYMSEDGKWMTFNNANRIYEGDQNASKSTGTHFTALYPSHRGNVFILSKSQAAEGLMIDNVTCSNYIDLHMNVMRQNSSLEPLGNKGFQSTIEYEFAIWGNADLTEKQVLEIGEQSIKSGTLKF